MMKKIFIGAISFTTIAIPISLVISCDTDAKDYEVNIKIPEWKEKNWVDESLVEYVSANINLLSFRSLTLNIVNICGENREFVYYSDDTPEEYSEFEQKAFDFASKGLSDSDVTGFMNLWAQVVDSHRQ